MRRWTILAVLLMLTVALVATGYAQTAGQSSTGSAQATDPGKAPVVEKPAYPGMAPVRNPDGSEIKTSQHPVVEKPSYPGQAVPRMPDGTPINSTTNFGSR
jgi:hypothetical protein